MSSIAVSRQTRRQSVVNRIYTSLMEMDLRVPFAALAGCGLVLLICMSMYLLISKNAFGTPAMEEIGETVDLGSVSGNSYAEFEWSMSYTDYMKTYGVDISIVAEVNPDEPEEIIEVIDLGETGILGSSLNIDNFDDSEWSIDQDIQNASVIASGKPVKEPTYGEEDDQGQQTAVIEGPAGEGPAVKEYVPASNSVQSLNYIIYKP